MGTSPTLVTVRQFAESHPGLTEPAVRWDLVNRKTNGLEKSGAIVYRGRRILLIPDRYLAWMARRGRRRS